MADAPKREYPIVNPETLAWAARELLADIDEWLGNDEPASMETIDMVIEWREALAAALGRPKRG
jgi:hypothetical protein